VTLYGYARDPSAPEPEQSSAHVPQPRPVEDAEASDLWGDEAFGPSSLDDAYAPSPLDAPSPFGTYSDPLFERVDPPEPIELPAAPATVSARVSMPTSLAPVQAGPPPVSAVPSPYAPAEPLDSFAPVDSFDPFVPPRGSAEPPTQAPSEAADLQAVLAWADDALAPETPEIQPWDRRPLLVVLAAAAALVLVAVVSGAASAALFRPTPASWQGPNGQASAEPSPGGTQGAAPPIAGDTITMSGVGDVIMGTQYRGGGGKIPPNNGQGFFDPVKSALASDLVMGNLETTLTVDTGVTKCAPTETSCFQFFLPPSYANYLKDGGFQVMNLANNHTHDMGAAGLVNTRAALDAAGVGYTGAPGEIKIVNVKGMKVAVLGFSVYSWGGNLNNIPAAVALVKNAAAQADLVVIQMQGGAEGADKSHVVPGHEIFLGEDRGDLIAFSHAVIDAGADVIFGHGPHIMRGMEFYKGRLIAYSLGNFCGYGTLNSAGFLGVGGVLKVTLHRDGTWAGGSLVSTELVRGGMVDVDPAKRALGFVQGLSTADFGNRAARISPSDGTVSPPIGA
jgi:hypothetical protein